MDRGHLRAQVRTGGSGPRGRRDPGLRGSRSLRGSGLCRGASPIAATRLDEAALEREAAPIRGEAEGRKPPAGRGRDRAPHGCDPGKRFSLMVEPCKRFSLTVTTAGQGRDQARPHVLHRLRRRDKADEGRPHRRSPPPPSRRVAPFAGSRRERQGRRALGDTGEGGALLARGLLPLRPPIPSLPPSLLTEIPPRSVSSCSDLGPAPPSSPSLPPFPLSSVPLCRCLSLAVSPTSSTVL